MHFTSSLYCIYHNIGTVYHTIYNIFIANDGIFFLIKMYYTYRAKKNRFISITEFNPIYSNELELDSLVVKIANNSITLSSADR
jgi:hypothetical protein